MNTMSLNDFAKLCCDTIKDDRYLNVVVSGETGEGKSTFAVKLCNAYSRHASTPWSFDNITWSRDELLTWIDGKKDSKRGANGLKEGQLPKRSAILIDELFLLFYKRTWFKEQQINSIATLNMCRDRHIFLVGCNPTFADLDTAFRQRVHYHVYIPRRGFAYVFMKEENPFNPDAWNLTQNLRLYRKHKVFSKTVGFVGLVNYSDWKGNQEEEYRRIRNAKRLLAMDEAKKEREKGKYPKWTKQRNTLIKYLHHEKGEQQNRIAEMCGMDFAEVSRICNGVAGA